MAQESRQSSRKGGRQGGGQRGARIPSLRAIINSPEWWSQAACRGADTRIFFPDVGQGYREAREFCRRCLVKPECLEDALSMPRFRDEVGGMRGGLEPKERSKIRSQRNRKNKEK